MESPIIKQILRKAIESPTFSKDILPVAPMSIFEGDEIAKELSTVLKRYYQTHRDQLTEETFLTIVEEKLDRMKRPPEEQQAYFTRINSLYEIRNASDDDVIDENIEKYIRKHLWKAIIMKAASNLDHEDKMEKIVEEFRDVQLLSVSGRGQEIINVLDDTEAKRQALSTLNQNTIPTGFESIDHLNGGGLAKGELGMVVASSGTGKTLVLTNLATNYTKLRYNVLFIALEELKNRMILKFEQAMLKQSKSRILSGAALNEDHFNKMQDFYKKNRANFGNLFFSRFSPNTITPSKVEQLISDVKLRQGIDIDVVIIDYPELLRNPNKTGNEAEDGGRLYEEMRRIGQDYNVVMWTASQMNRTAYSAQIRTAEHMEGSHRKKNAAELILTVNQTPEEYNAGFTRLYADKVRNPPEGPFDRMLGLKVVGSEMTVREYRNDGERAEHQAILDSLDTGADQSFRGRKKERKDNTPAPDFAGEINSSINRMRGNQ